MAAGDRVYAVIAGGGTAGHVYPGLAVARALIGRGHSVHWVGGRRGMETRLVPTAEMGLTLLGGRGIERRITLANVRATGELAGAVAGAYRVLGSLRPRVLVALGGWASVACSLAAAPRRVPIVVMEQNAVPGLANRIAARRARAVATAFAGTGLPRAVVTGNPVREEIIGVGRGPEARAAAKAALGLPEGRRVVGVSGGSLGSRRINLATLAAAGLWAGRSDLAVHHVVGARDWDLVAPDLPVATAGALFFQAVAFEDRMDLLLSAADVMVTRSGGSVAELAVAGVPSILVPLPGAPGDHQTANARALVESGAAVLVPDGELDGQRMVAEVDALVGDPARLDAMAAAALALGRPGAAEAVADLVEEHANRD